MKKLFYLVIATILLTCCAEGIYMPAKTSFGSTSVVTLREANFRVVKNIDVTIEINNTNLRRTDVEKSAYAELLRRAHLSGSQCLINVVVEEIRREKGSNDKQFVGAHATVIEFLRPDGTPVASVSSSAAETYKVEPIQENHLPINAAAAVAEVADAQSVTNILEQNDEPINDNVVKAIDLGLSVKWCNMNIGAEYSTQLGNYYAWAEIETKTNFDWTNYKFGNALQKSLSKYCLDDKSGSKDGKSKLDSADDVATRVLGVNWRTPTKDEWNELIMKCKWQWKKISGHWGYLGTSKINGNQIFLPAQGYMNGNKLIDNLSGSYWTMDSNSSLACSAKLTSDQKAVIYVTRNLGMLIRPVQNK